MSIKKIWLLSLLHKCFSQIILHMIYMRTLHFQKKTSSIVIPTQLITYCHIGSTDKNLQFDCTLLWMTAKVNCRRGQVKYWETMCDPQFVVQDVDVFLFSCGAARSFTHTHITNTQTQTHTQGHWDSATQTVPVTTPDTGTWWASQGIFNLMQRPNKANFPSYLRNNSQRCDRKYTVYSIKHKLKLITTP